MNFAACACGPPAGRLVEITSDNGPVSHGPDAAPDVTVNTTAAGHQPAHDADQPGAQAVARQWDADQRLVERLLWRGARRAARARGAPVETPEGDAKPFTWRARPRVRSGHGPASAALHRWVPAAGDMNRAGRLSGDEVADATRLSCPRRNRRRPPEAPGSIRRRRSHGVFVLRAVGAARPRRGGGPEPRIDWLVECPRGIAIQVAVPENGTTPPDPPRRRRPVDQA